MDIRVYFQKIREIERNIQDPYVVVVSLETPEGGKPGRATEVSSRSRRETHSRGERSPRRSPRESFVLCRSQRGARRRRRREDRG